MRKLIGGLKRVLVGKPIRSSAISNQLLPKRWALPAFSADALSSTAYAPDQILLTLALAGGAASLLSPWIAVAVALLLGLVVLAYRQTVYAYPEGGGDYHVVSDNLGRQPGLIVASALIIDYILTVAVSVGAGAAYISTAVPSLAPFRIYIAVGIIVILVILHLRGSLSSNRSLAIPTYFYLLVVGILIVFGLIKESYGTLGLADSAAYTVIPAPEYATGLAGIAGVFLLLRAFASGCVMLTGVEAISNGVPSFKPPKSRNAAATLALLGIIAMVLLSLITHLASVTGIKYVERPAEQLTLHGSPIASDVVLAPVLGQLAQTVFSDFEWAQVIVSVATGLILILAANTAFNGFPVLASVLSRDSFLPHQLYKRGDRLSYSNGILVLGVAAIAITVAVQGSVSALIHMYLLGVFISFSFSQFSMVKHWNRRLQVEIKADKRKRYRRARVINSVAFVSTVTVLLIVVITKFFEGAWIALVAMSVVYGMMLVISNHYRDTAAELEVENLAAARVLPTRVHAVVLVSSLNRPAMRAISYARAAHPTTAEIISVVVSEQEMERLRIQWIESGVPIPLTFVDSPYRDVVRPVLKYIKTLRRRNPRDLVVVYIPEYIVSKWWQNLLHNQTATKLKTALLFNPGVVVCSVPWQLGQESESTSLVRVVTTGDESAAPAK